MRANTLWRLAGATACLALLLVAQCLPIPTIEEKIIELAVGGGLTAQFDAEGELNFHNDAFTVSLSDSIDLEEILADADIDPSEVHSVRVAGVAYRVIEPDPTPNRRIENGTITVQRQGGAVTDLVVNFNADVNSAIEWQKAPLAAEGVEVINVALADLLTEVQTGVPAPNMEVTFTVTGNSVPGSVPTDFRWEMRLFVSIVGSVAIDFVEF